MSKPFLPIIKEYNIYSDRIMRWIRRRNEFRNTIVMYYPAIGKKFILLLTCSIPKMYSGGSDVERLALTEGTARNVTHILREMIILSSFS